MQDPIRIKTMKLTFILMLGLMGYSNGFSQPIYSGTPTPYKLKIPLEKSVTKCNIEISVPGMGTREEEVTTPLNEVLLQLNIPQEGPLIITWKGKAKFRGLFTVTACPGSGSVTETVVSNTEQLRQKWAQVFSRLNPEQAECVRIGLHHSGLKSESADPTAALADPSGPSVKSVFDTCDRFLARKLRANFACVIPNKANAKSLCDEEYRQDKDGRSLALTLEDAMRLTFEGQPIRVGMREKDENRERREKAEVELREREAAALASKAAEEEKQRRWLASPEYKRQQEELAKQQIRDREVAEKRRQESLEKSAKAKREQDELEARKAAEARDHAAKAKREQEELEQRKAAEAKDQAAKAKREQEEAEKKKRMTIKSATDI